MPFNYGGVLTRNANKRYNRRRKLIDPSIPARDSKSGERSFLPPLAFHLRSLAGRVGRSNPPPPRVYASDLMTLAARCIIPRCYSCPRTLSACDGTHYPLHFHSTRYYVRTTSPSAIAASGACSTRGRHGSHHVNAGVINSIHRRELISGRRSTAADNAINNCLPVSRILLVSLQLGRRRNYAEI